MITDEELWRSWWYAVLYGMGAPRRMQLMDKLRKQNK